MFAEPGKLVTLDEFQGMSLLPFIEFCLIHIQDWYNNEHVPLRLNHLPSFLTGARYSATDGKIPSWIAVYDIDDTATFQHESYTRLRANRSSREGDLVKRLEILDRRTTEYVYDSGESSLTSSFKYENPSKVLLTYGVTLEDGKIQSWASDVKASLEGVDGWVRTRVFLCFDSLKTGVGIPEGPEAQKVPKYLVVHGKIRAHLTFGG